MRAESRKRFAAIFGRFKSLADGEDRGAEIDAELLASTIERVINGTEEKIRLVPGYKKKLKPAVVSALIYADRLVREIPKPIDISCRDFSTNPYVNAFFASPKDIVEAVYHSSELRDYSDEWMNSDRNESYVLLCMRMVEKDVFGMELVGDDLVRDVPQTSVSFCDHRIYSPAPSESQARLELRCCFLDGLIERALADITTLRATRRHLDIEYRRLSARARQAVTSATSVETRKLLAELEEARTALVEVGHVTPEVCLEKVLGVLNSPEQFVRLHHVSLNVDRMGIKVTAESQRTSSRLDLAEAEMGGQPSRVVILGRLLRNEVIPPGGIPDRHHRLMEAVHV